MFGLALKRKFIPKFVPKIYVNIDQRDCKDCLNLNRDYCIAWKENLDMICVGGSCGECEYFKPYKEGRAVGCPSCSDVTCSIIGSGKQYISRRSVVCNVCHGKGWIWKKLGAVV